jgi:hypothetical protein
MKTVYSAVRTGSLNTGVCASALNGYLRRISDLCYLQHKLIGFYNRDEKCLQRGTDWVFKYSSLRFGFKGLNLWLPRFFFGACQRVSPGTIAVTVRSFIYQIQGVTVALPIAVF